MRVVVTPVEAVEGVLGGHPAGADLHTYIGSESDTFQHTDIGWKRREEGARTAPTLRKPSMVRLRSGFSRLMATMLEQR